jgi:hypothetical protein
MNSIADQAGWAKFKEPVATYGTTGKSSYGDLKMQFKNTGRYSDLSIIDEQSMTAYAKVPDCLNIAHEKPISLSLSRHSRFHDWTLVFVLEPHAPFSCPLLPRSVRVISYFPPLQVVEYYSVSDPA